MGNGIRPATPEEVIMKISIGSDHRGLPHRVTITEILNHLGHEVDDRGTHTEESCDYPDIAADVATQVASGASEKGILVCGTGIGMSMAANKFPGIRAAVCHDVESAELSRQHNDANILCLPGKDLTGDRLKEVVSAWMASGFEGGRHERRVGQDRHSDLR